MKSDFLGSYFCVSFLLALSAAMILTCDRVCSRQRQGPGCSSWRGRLFSSHVGHCAGLWPCRRVYNVLVVWLFELLWEKVEKADLPNFYSIAPCPSERERTNQQ